MKLSDIAKEIEAELTGDGSIEISRVAALDEAQEGQISFLANKKYASLASSTKASAVIVGSDWDGEAPCVVLKVKDPDLAFTKAAILLAPPQVVYEPGVDPSAVLAADVDIGEGVHIGANAVIEDGVTIGDGTIISAGCCIGHNTKIGSKCKLYPLVSTRENTLIGDRVVIHNGAVIGSDGFGYYKDGEKWGKIPQLGIVEIEDDVEIGANVTVDRARFGKTVIGKGSKLDNLVQIAHNVRLGENTAMAAQAGVAGSTTIGNNVQMGGQAAVTGHVTVGDNAIIGGKSGVLKDVPAGMFVSGFPSMDHRTIKKIHAHTMNLPKLREKVKELEKIIKQLQERAEDK